MNKKLYVGNLSFEMQEQDLKTLFEEGGRSVASARIISDRDTGRSRGFGFVEFANPQDAQSAIESMNGREINGRALVVNEAREQTPKFGGGGGGGGYNRRPSNGGFRGDRSNRW
jgi:cold-inducible RNA-binding protein